MQNAFIIPETAERDRLKNASLISRARRIALRIHGSSDSLAIGAGEPMRLIAPFGYSSAADLGINLQTHVAALAKAGADAIQELSTMGPYRDARLRICTTIGIPYGTVLAYEFFDRLRKQSRVTESIGVRLAVEILDEQCAAGISYTTIHASLNRHLLALTERSRRQRAVAIPSRSAAMLMSIMHKYNIDNPLSLAWRDLISVLKRHRIAVSMGSSLRPAAISDALDHCHKAEILAQGPLVLHAHQQNVGVMVEGLSHAVPEDIEKYVELVHQNCDCAPATALGPLPVDVAAGHDDVAAVPGIVFGRLAGLSSVNVVTAKEHLAMPSTEDMVKALRLSKLAVYIADTIKVGRNARRDRLMSEAREALNWSAQKRYGLFPDLIAAFSPEKDGQPCTICASRCPHLLTGTRYTDPSQLSTPYNSIHERPRSLREVLVEALAPVTDKAEIIWFGSLAHSQKSLDLEILGLAGSDVDLTILADDADEMRELLDQDLNHISIGLARSNYGSHISVAYESPANFLSRLNKRPDLWNAIWRDGISLSSSDSVLRLIQRGEARHVDGELVVRYAVRSFELTILQIALAAAARAPEQTLSVRILIV
jgi:phosphomethylpyrimidine synthase